MSSELQEAEKLTEAAARAHAAKVVAASSTSFLAGMRLLVRFTKSHCRVEHELENTASIHGHQRLTPAQPQTQSLLLQPAFCQASRPVHCD